MCCLISHYPCSRAAEKRARSYCASGPGNVGYALFAVSRADLQKLRDLHRGYLRAMQRRIASSEPNECVGLYCAQLPDRGRAAERVGLAAGALGVPPLIASRSASVHSKGMAKPSTTAAKAAPKTRTAKSAEPPDVATLLAELERNGSSKFRADLSARYGIVTKDPAFGTPMAKIKLIARKVGRDHALAEALWKTRIYEARLLASLVDEPERVTRAQMNRWAKDFDNWAVVDTLCFNLFDRTPHAFAQIATWSKSKDEFVKRAAFALLASLALHGRAQDEELLRALPLIERASGDERNFVKKGVSWALRAIGRKPSLRAAARALAQRLAKSEQAAARWTGRDALREFAKQA